MEVESLMGSMVSKLSMLSMILVAGAGLGRAADWPQWRGPHRDGVWTETGLVEKFESAQLPLLWRVELGSGYCGPTVADGRLYVMDRVVQPTRQERVQCFDAGTGKPLWSYAYDCVYERVQYEAGPRASVTVDAGRTYSLGTMGHLHCLDARSGKVLWSHDGRQEYAARVPIWGVAGAPLVEGDLLIVPVGGKDDACLMAFDKATGQEKWRALMDGLSYSTPVIIEQARQQVLVYVTDKRIVGLEPRTGQLYWEYPFVPNKMEITIATPVCDGRHLVVTSQYDGMLVLTLHSEDLGVDCLWQRRGASEIKTDALHCCISTPVILGEQIYGVDSYGELRGLELKTGDRLWENLTATPKARWSNIHLVRNGDKFWMFNERGELLIARLAPDGFHEISRTKLLDPTTGQLNQRGGVCWSHPAFANQRVYARNDKELICADLAAKP